ncbi:hypothetical protein [Micromonospora endophytica]|uniref:Uncharacterized protein n=1 Tax=Micromonospora endophytica TaxID=515350 RepID=A0A2W2DBI7_9ACTN|nr:hypothetical protein [Micromonospora endophytica]PZF89953.1 hypothetical protein C1I93_23340 [Micromonospora endophytica]RIW42661.1 hypothetical protein D3H59_22590 [Micromonospora endophytica]BCJ60694.1 hypothetical protein Jiend_41160 [Micromonospora endophytica]
MPEQTQPWAERTVEVPPQPDAAVPPQRDPFRRGVASVGPRTPPTEPFPTVEHEPTGTGWPGEPAPRRPLSWHVAQLKRGGEWSMAGALFAFVCWGIWAISAGGDLAGQFLIFILSLLVAAGLFALARLLGRVVLERQLGRIRRSARGAHLVTAIFLTGLGIAYLQQTQWVLDAWSWLTT